MENETMVVVDESGEETLYEIVLTFENQEFGKFCSNCRSNARFFINAGSFTLCCISSKLSIARSAIAFALSTRTS